MRWLEGASEAQHCSAHEHQSCSPLWKSRTVFFHSTNHHYSILFLRGCNTVASASFPSTLAGYHLSPPYQQWTFHVPSKPSLYLLVPPRQPLTTSPGLSRMPCRWWWWAVAWFQAPRAGKLCQSESLCFLITVVRSKPKLAICKVTFILLPTLFLCPWLTELSFLFVSLFIFNSLLCQLCLDPKMGWVKELLLFQTNLKANWIQVSA